MISTIFRTAPMALALMAYGLFGAGLARATQANDANMFPSETVHFGDLNLNTAAGVEVLYQRINQAAETVCSEQVADVLDLPGHSIWRHCVESAVARSIAKVGNERLAALYAQEHSKRVG